MKFRIINRRKVFLTTQLFQEGCLYHCVKINNKDVKFNNYWFNVPIWLCEKETSICSDIFLQKGHFAGIKHFELLPSIIFNENFKFVRINDIKSLVALSCCERTIIFNKEFK